MFNEKETGLDLSMCGLSCFCDMVSGLCPEYPELTEAQLQEIEERADRWYLSMM